MAEPLSPNNSHMPQLDSLRALAVAGVAYHHWMPEAYHFGIPFWAGVPLFFVLSGFLISSILVQCRTSDDPWFALRAFYARRFLRIFPLFYAVIAACYLLNIYPMRETVGWHVSYLSNVYFFLRQDWHGNVSHFWSLAVEEQFYLLWPGIVLFVPSRWLLRAFLALTIAGLLSVLLMPVAFPNAKLLRVLPNFSFFAMGLGGLLAIRNRCPWIAIAIVKAGACAAIPCVALIAAGTGSVDTLGQGQALYCLLILLFAWLIHRAAAGFTGVVGTILNMPLLVYLGRISYGLYILHNFADVPVALTCERFLGMAPEELTLAQVVSLKTFFTMSGAVLSWHLFEKPLNSLKRFFPYRR